MKLNTLLYCCIQLHSPLCFLSLGIEAPVRDSRCIPGPDGVDFNGEEMFFNDDADTSRHIGVLFPTMQVRIPDVAFVPTEISS